MPLIENITSIRELLALTKTYGLEVEQMDVNTTFP
jgi:hypothetical protein